MSLSKAVDDFWEWYKQSLKEHPIQTRVITFPITTPFSSRVAQVVTSASLSFLGDLIAQKVIAKQPFVIQRSAKFTAWGGIVSTLVFFWYTFLEKTFRGTKNAMIYKVLIMPPFHHHSNPLQLLLDQLVWSPLLACLFFTYAATLDGSPAKAQVQITM